MFWTMLLLVLTIILYLTQPFLGLAAIKKVFGISLFLQLFYILGSFISDWPFPTPVVIIQIMVVVALAVAMGATFSRIWPLSPKPGFERILRTFLIIIPSLGIGLGLQVLLQGGEATQAIYLIFALSAWLGSAHFVRRT